MAGVESASLAVGPRRGSPFDRRLVAEVPVIGRTVAASVLIGLLSTAAVVVQAVALASLLAGAMPGAHPSDRLRAFVWLGSAVLVRAATAFCGEVAANVGASHAKAVLRERLIDVLVEPGATTTTRGGGDVAALASRGLDALDVYVGRCLPDLVLAVAAPLALAVAVGVFDWLSAVIICVALVLFPVFGALVGRAAMTLASERWGQVEALGRQITDVFEGLPVLRAFGRSRQQRARIVQANEALRRASLSTLRTAFLSALVLDTLASVSVALVAVPLGLRLLDGSIRLSAALAVLIVAPEVFLPLRRASAEFHESTEGLAAVGRVMSLVGRGGGATGPSGWRSTAEPIRSSRGAPDPGRLPIVLHSVTVNAPDREKPLLDRVSLSIEPGETVALVGPSGAGKSTLLSVLLDFRSPDTGAVTVGGTDLRALDPTDWRTRITWLPEHPTLVAGTLAENLRLAAPAASDADLLAVLAEAGACGFLQSLAAGLDTPIGDGGRPISAGERQRIAVARTLLRPAPLYLLDEPTVHLDKESELLVLAGLRRALAGHSALVVTHRPAVSALADRTVALRDGRIVALGRDEPFGGDDGARLPGTTTDPSLGQLSRRPVSA